MYAWRAGIANVETALAIVPGNAYCRIDKNDLAHVYSIRNFMWRKETMHLPELLRSHTARRILPSSADAAALPARLAAVHRENGSLSEENRQLHQENVDQKARLQRLAEQQAA